MSLFDVMSLVQGTACRMVQQRVSLALCGPFNAWRQQSQQAGGERDCHTLAGTEN